MPRKNPRYAFSVDRLEIVEITAGARIPRASWTAPDIKMVNLGRNGLGLPVTATALVLGSEVEVTFAVHGAPPSLGFRLVWTVLGNVIHFDTGRPYFGVQISAVKSPPGSSQKDLYVWIKCLSAISTQLSPYKAPLESVAVMINAAGVASGLSGLVFPMPPERQLLLMKLMVYSIAAYIFLRFLRLCIEWLERNA